MADISKRILFPGSFFLKRYFFWEGIFLEAGFPLVDCLLEPVKSGIFSQAVTSISLGLEKHNWTAFQVYFDKIFKRFGVIN